MLLARLPAVAVGLQELERIHPRGIHRQSTADFGSADRHLAELPHQAVDDGMLPDVRGGCTEPELTSQVEEGLILEAIYVHNFSYSIFG